MAGKCERRCVSGWRERRVVKRSCTVLFSSVKLGLVLTMLAVASALHVPVPVRGELHVWPHRNCRLPCRSRKTNPGQDRINLQGLNKIHKQHPTWSLRGGWSSPRVMRQAILEEKKSPWPETDESTSRSGDEVATIATLVEKVGDVMQRRGGRYEIICVNDGSTDQMVLQGF